MSETPPPAPNSTPEPTPDPIPTTPPTATGPVADPADVEKNKVMAILAYLGILVLVPLLAAKESPFARYHTNQGLLLCIISVVLWLILFVGGIVLGAVTGGIGSCVTCAVGLPIFICVLVLAIMGIINAVNGKMQPLPVIGTLFTILK